MSNMIGKTISHFKITEKLGEGGMGEVYLANDQKLERQVAIKFLPEHLTKDKENVERFEREAKAAAALNHPNIVTIHEISEFDDQIFIVMEYVDGLTLSVKIKDERLKIKEVNDYAKQIVEALNTAHKKDIIHRDIKSENIMVTEIGQIKVMDFGLAKLKGVSKLTKETSTLGTIYIMSPEQLQGKEVDHRSDIWSLGVVLYEMITGKLPFKGEYESAIMYSIMNEEPESVKKIRPDCSDSLSNIVTKCLQKKPQERFQSMQEILTAFEDDSYNVSFKKEKSEIHNLPVQLTSFIGREKEIESVKQLISKNRLVTLTGAGGCGKTRLAGEIAATRIRHLGPEAILERLEDQFKILASSSRTAPKRQQTLKATIDWSYNLLSEEEKLLFNRLSVFAGEFSLEAVEEVCSDDQIIKDDIFPILSQLVDKSLVITENQEDESMRYKCLIPLHQYSQTKLNESGEEKKCKKHHLSYYLQMAEQAYDEQFDSELKWLNTLESEHDNLIAALNWAYNQSVEDFILLSGYLVWFWKSHSHIGIAEDSLEKALQKDVKKSEGYARALCGLGLMQFWVVGGGIEKVKKLMNESLAIWRQLKNLKEEAITLSWFSYALPAAGEFESGLKHSTRGLEIARKVGSPGLINQCLLCICQVYVHSKQYSQGEPLAEELLASSEKLGHIYGIECARHYLGDCALGTEDFKEAEKRYALAVETALKYGYTWLAAVDLQGVALALSGQLRWAKSIRLDSAAREKVNSMGSRIDGIAQFWDEWIETYLISARKKVGEELTRKYEEEGKNMGFEAAVEYALDFDKD
jgi:serine/threonine protein kinase